MSQGNRYLRPQTISQEVAEGAESLFPNLRFLCFLLFQ